MSAAQFSDLPVELLSKIAKNLSIPECTKLERVNAVWRGVMLRQWQRNTSIDFGKFLSANALKEAKVVKNNLEHHESYQPTSKKQRTIIKEDMATWLHSLCKKVSPHVKEIKIGSKVSFLTEDILSEIISMAVPKLSTLELDYVDHAQMERVLELQGISDLRIKFCMEEKLDAEFFAVFKKVLHDLINLKHFSFVVNVLASSGSTSSYYDTSDSESDSESDEYDKADYLDSLISYIPSSLHSLQFCFCGEFIGFDEGVSAFEKLHSDNLKVLHLEHDLADCFSIDARNFPNLTELHIVGVEEVRHLKTLKHLEKLSFRNKTDDLYLSWLKTITSDDCEFRSSLLELTLVWHRKRTLPSERYLYQDVPLSNLALLPSLQSLTFCGLPSTEADKVFGLRSIGEVCMQLNELKIFNSDLGETELSVISESFPNLTSFSQNLTTFLNQSLWNSWKDS